MLFSLARTHTHKHTSVTRSSICKLHLKIRQNGRWPFPSIFIHVRLRYIRVKNTRPESPMGIQRKLSCVCRKSLKNEQDRRIFSGDSLWICREFWQWELHIDPPEYVSIPARWSFPEKLTHIPWCMYVSVLKTQMSTFVPRQGNTVRSERKKLFHIKEQWMALIFRSSSSRILLLHSNVQNA